MLSLRITEKTPRFILASIGGTLAILVIPFIGLLLGLRNVGSVLADGTPDNAPMRAIYALLFLLPIFAIVLFLGILVCSYLLWRFRLLSGRTVFVCIVAVSLVVGVHCGHVDCEKFGLFDGLQTFGIFFMLTFLFLSCGGYVWWRIANAGNNKWFLAIANLLCVRLASPKNLTL